MKKIDIIKNCPVFLINSIEELLKIEEEELEEIFIKNKVETIIIKSNIYITNEYNFINFRKYLKFDSSFCYLINRYDLIQKNVILLPDLKEYRFKNYNQFKKFTKKKLWDLCQMFPEYLNRKNLEFYMGIFTNLKSLNSISYFAIKKNKKIVAYWFLMPGREPDSMNPADWVYYIWIDKDYIKIDERENIHNFFSHWLYLNVNTQKIYADVKYFNIRSQKFFRKIGFEPQCIFIDLKKQVY
jgi:hypothetical protein